MACSTSPTATAAPARTIQPSPSSARSTCRLACRDDQFASTSRPASTTSRRQTRGRCSATQTGAGGQNPDATTWQVWKITPDGNAAIFFQGAPLRQPNGIAFDRDGNIVVVNIGTEDVITLSKEGKVVGTEKAVQSGNDGLVVMRDGTKYVSSVVNGGVSRIRPGRPAELVAQNIPNPASMCYDPDENQLVIPMNANNALAFIKLR